MALLIPSKKRRAFGEEDAPVKSGLGRRSNP
jgi:hypothetical protein